MKAEVFAQWFPVLVAFPVMAALTKRAPQWVLNTIILLGGFVLTVFSGTYLLTLPAVGGFSPVHSRMLLAGLVGGGAWTGVWAFGLWERRRAHLGETGEPDDLSEAA